MAELITVMAAKVNGRVVLWEPNPAHPTGEAFVAGDGRSVQVALTPRVQKALDAGTLLKVQAATPEPPAPADTPPWADYDGLSATAIVERLAGLTDAERDAVRAYEAARKNRKTVLEALG